MTMLFHRKQMRTKIICTYFSAVIDAIDYESLFKVVIKFKKISSVFKESLVKIQSNRIFFVFKIYKNI